MRRVLRPIRLGVVGVCVLVVMGLVAAPSAAGAGAAPQRPWMDSSLRPEARARLLLARMTLEEKVGQMTQAERGAVTADPSLVTTWRLGSLLSGGGSVPTPTIPEAWADMVDAFQPGPWRPASASPWSTGLTRSTATATWSGRPCSPTTSAWARPATPGSSPGSST